MSTSAYFVADHTFSDLNNYWPSDNSNSFVAINGTTAYLNTKRVPANSSDTGIPGEFCFGTDSGTTYLYYCTGVNTWVRTLMSTW